MHKDRPVAQLLLPVVSGKMPKLLVCFMLLLGAFMLSATATAAPAKGDKPAAAQAKQADPSQFVGSETCATCHEEVSKGFANNPHTKIAEMHGKSGVTCEGCHGPGKAHVDGGGDVTKIFDPAKASTKDVDATCLTCHAGTHPNFERSPHAKANVGCTSCHSVHKSADKEQLLKASQPTLCFQCHNDTKPQFEMPFHHKVNEGAVSCSDCHDPHGTFGNNNLKSTADQNAICTKCHTETRGPFVYEHAAVKAEGCVGCHTPHGSQNARLLNMPNVNTLCNQCHSPVASGTVHSMNAGSSELSPCTSCHTFIHGSNMNQAFLR
ncbi:MAG TPA: DmsE family decaheme c-type cytochrome [Terracidiphilus sp.]|jgi:DmsE family decaheme c-type cytochrome|nr:DmsE family decaheme c-type cytochrome [Terracidiphilus sp.]